MKFNMPYVYGAVVIPPRARNAVSKVLGGYVDLEIPEASAEDAPLALRWQEEVDLSIKKASREGRMFDGQFYSSVVNDEYEIIADDQISYRDLHLFAHSGVYSDPHDIDRFIAGELTQELSDFREVLHSEEAEVIQSLQKEVENFLIVDGILYRSGLSPMIKATANQFADRANVRLELTYVSSGPNRWNELHFPISQLDEARRWAEHIVAMSGKETKEIDDAVVVEMVNTGHLVEDDVFISDLIRLTSSQLRASETKLFEYEDDFIDAWQALRRASRSLSLESDEQAINNTMNAWENLLVEFDKAEFSKDSFGVLPYDPSSEVGHKMYSLFLPRWEDRPIGSVLQSNSSLNF